METEIFFVLLVTVVLLHERMSVGAVLPLRTFLLLLYVGAHLRRVEVPVTTAVLVGVVVYAVLVVVALCYVARTYLENLQVEMLSKLQTTLTVGATANL